MGYGVFAKDARQRLFYDVEPTNKAAKTILETVHKISKVVPDFVNCIVVATAISKKEDLITEDSLILEKKEKLLKDYNLTVLSFKDVART